MAKRKKTSSVEFVEVSAVFDKFINLMAGESIRVQRGNYDTASIDLKNMVVKIPLFALEDEPTNVLMSAHEVSHALHTPKDWYHKADSHQFTRNMLSCINIVEDIRIEKLIRNKFIGLIRSFHAGYEYLLANKFFGDLDRPMCFADRVNVWAKCRTLSPVRLANDAEIAAYKYISTANTFDEVLVRARFLYHFNVNTTIESGEGLDYTLSEFDEAGGDGDGDSIDIEDLPEALKRKIQDAMKRASRDDNYSTEGESANIRTEIASASKTRSLQDHHSNEIYLPDNPSSYTLKAPGIFSR